MNTINTPPEVISSQQLVPARVISTDQRVLVDDLPLWFGFVKCYNMWHSDIDGNVWHDDELEFIGQRYQ